MSVNELLSSINENYFRKISGGCISKLPEIQGGIAEVFGSKIDPINYFTSSEEMPNLGDFGVSYLSEDFFALMDEINRGRVELQKGIVR